MRIYGSGNHYCIDIATVNEVIAIGDGFNRGIAALEPCELIWLAIRHRCNLHVWGFGKVAYKIWPPISISDYAYLEHSIFLVCVMRKCGGIVAWE